MAGSAATAGPTRRRARVRRFDASLTGAFDAFGRQHDLVVGASASRTKGDYDTYPLWTAPGYDPKIPDIRQWNGDMPEPDWQSTGKRYYTEKQASIYGAVRLRPTDALRPTTTPMGRPTRTTCASRASTPPMPASSTT
ncbi:hypothetical protein G6F57_022001 [Rhizopus arrhizus]|nr:hypothetical protein G6F57_022001 [Rhizopus arrhizus]